MSDFNLVDPEGWDCDLHSVYSAFIGHFQLHGIPWYSRSWGSWFATFDAFVAFSWPVITLTDCWTGRAHIVTRTTSIGAFIKMIKSSSGETLPIPDNILKIRPFENSQKPLRNIDDHQMYKKLHATLPAVELAAMKVRVRSGEPKAIRALWATKEKTFLSIDFEWSERNNSSILEWGYAALRCSHLDAIGVWPPVPATNYRKGHFIISEYVDKVVNKRCPTFPWQYAFGESQVVSKNMLPQIIQTVISSLASPSMETSSNDLVLVAHGIHSDLKRLEEMKIKLPQNMLIVDTAAFERTLSASGLRGVIQDPKTGQTMTPNTSRTLSLEHLILSLNVGMPCAWHNAGNDAFMCLFAFQKLMDPDGTITPDVSEKIKRPVMYKSPTTGTMPQNGLHLPALPGMYAPFSPTNSAHLKADLTDQKNYSRRSSFAPVLRSGDAESARKSKVVSPKNRKKRQSLTAEKLNQGVQSVNQKK